MPVKVLFLDFDGVIADSDPIKSVAMIAAFEGVTGQTDAVVDGFKRYAGSGRELIFDRIYEHVTGNALQDDDRDRIEGVYVERLEARRSELGLFAGVDAFIARESERRLVSVVTGVPADEALADLTRLGVLPFLTGIASATREAPKHILMDRFLAAHDFAPADALFVGDSLSDMQAGARVPVDFIGVGPPAFFAGGAPIAVVDKLVEITPWLER